MSAVKRPGGLVGLLIACVVIAAASLFIGSEPVGPLRALQEWRDGHTAQTSAALHILLYQRLPRTLAAVIAGAGLALAGCAFQALLRNPLATPYTLGVASAGAFGAWTAHIMLDKFRDTALAAFNAALLKFGVSLTQFFAFAAALADVAIIYTLARRNRRVSPSVLLLAGVTLGMMANAGIMLMRYFARPDQLVAVERWLMGGVDVIGFAPIYTLLIGVVPCAILILLLSAQFDQLGFSPEIAEGRGVHIGRLFALTFLGGSLMTAFIVSEVGPIGFVGLIVPHTVRLFTGPRHRILMPVSVVAGGAFLCACDIVARVLLPGETPIGIITALIGVPVFLYLMLRRGFTDWEDS